MTYRCRVRPRGMGGTRTGGSSRPAPSGTIELPRRLAYLVSPTQTLPPVIWSSYRHDMIQARPDRGARAVSYDRKQLKKGKLRATLLSRNGHAVGFVLHPKVTKVGIEANTLYLMAGNRSAKVFRELLGSLLRERPVFTITGWSPGLNPRVMNAVLKGFGFRRVHRQWLYLDPSTVDWRTEPHSPFEFRPLRKSDERALARLTALAYAHHIDSAFGPGGDVSTWASEYVHGLFTDPTEDPIDFGSSFVCVQRGHLIGDVVVTKTRTGPHIMDLSVDPTYRGRGVATSLMVRAMGVLASRKVRRVDLSVSVENPTGASTLYRNLGFRRTPGPPRWPGIWIHERTRRRMLLRIRGE